MNGLLGSKIDNIRKRIGFVCNSSSNVTREC